MFPRGVGVTSDVQSHQLEGKWGALKTTPMMIPAMLPAIGIVAIQETSRRAIRCQLTAFVVPFIKPTPTVAPVMHIDVETGSEYWENMRMVMAAPISIEHPRLGEW